MKMQTIKLEIRSDLDVFQLVVNVTLIIAMTELSNICYTKRVVE